MPRARRSGVNASIEPPLSAAPRHAWELPRRRRVASVIFIAGVTEWEKAAIQQP
jgi:hypothetical protein